jgi:hypothetical protein
VRQSDAVALNNESESLLEPVKHYCPGVLPALVERGRVQITRGRDAVLRLVYDTAALHKTGKEPVGGFGHILALPSEFYEFSERRSLIRHAPEKFQLQAGSETGAPGQCRIAASFLSILYFTLDTSGRISY